MSQVQRQTTWASLQTLTAANLNGEFDNIDNAWNNHDAGTSRWTVTDSALIKYLGFTTIPVLQIVTATNATAKSTTSTSFVATNLAASITPKQTSSKILVCVVGNLSTNTNSAQAYLTLTRSTTNLFAANGAGAAAGTGNQANTIATIVYVDAPATTSAVTYAPYLKSDAGGTVLFGDNTTTQLITCIEFGT